MAANDPELVLLPNMERLPAFGTKALGLTFSAAANNAGLLPPDLRALGQGFLQPWSWRGNAESGADGWQPIEKLLLFEVPASGTALPAPREAPVAPPPGIETLEDALSDRYTRFSRLEAAGHLLDPWAEVGSGTAAGSRVAVSRQRRPWPALLAEASLYPAPLARKIGLSFFAQSPSDIGGGDVVAVPELQLRWQGSRIVLRPTTIETRGPGSVITVVYDDVQPPTTLPRIIARTVPAPQLGSSHYFDFATLWVKGDAGDVASIDWRSGLEHRLAQQLHLGPALADWMKDHAGDVAVDYPQRAWRLLAELALSAFPCLGDPALATDADRQRPSRFPGGRLLRRLAPHWRDSQGLRFESKVVDHLEDLARPWFFAAGGNGDGGSLVSSWAGWLLATVTSDAQAPPLLVAAAAGAPELQRLSLAETLASFDPLFAVAGTPRAAEAAFRGAWGRFRREHEAAHGPLEPALRELVVAFESRDPVDPVELGFEVLRSHVGRQWSALAPAFHGRACLGDLRGELRPRFRGLLTQLGIPDPGSKAWLDARVGKMVDGLLPGAEDADSADKSRRREPVVHRRGLTVQLDTLQPDPEVGDGSSEPAGDLLRHMQGIAVLARNKASQQWCCLNTARVEVDKVLLDDRVVLPARLAYVEGLRAPTVTYDNAPLTVESPLATPRVSQTQLEAAAAEDDALAELDEPILRFDYDATTALPGLRFGDDYLLAPFVISNSGAVPPELALDAAGTGWNARLPVEPAAPPSHGRPAQYRRETPVGALRPHFVDATGPPPIPAGVAPRIRELRVDRLLPAKDPLLTPLRGDRKDDPSPEGHRIDAMLAATPLLLLAGDKLPLRPGVDLRDELRLTIAPPTTDLETWQQWEWQADGADDQANRKKKDRFKFARRAYYRGLSKVAHEPGRELPRQDLEQAGVYLDDPAVKALLYEVVPFDWDGVEQAGKVKGRLALERRAPDPDFEHWHSGDTDLAHEQRKPVDVLCKLAADGRLEVTLEAGPATKLPAFPLYRLSFYAALDAGDDGPPPVAATPGCTPPPLAAGPRFRWTESVRSDLGAPATSPWHLFIEVPQPLLPATETGLRRYKSQLWRSLSPKWTAPAAPGLDGRVDVSLVLDPAADPQDPIAPGHLAHQIHRAELWHQVWGWRGRPPAPHPALGTGKPPSKPCDEETADEPLLDFEMSEFGERSDDEHRRLPMRRDFDAVATTRFVYSEPYPSAGPRADLRALHHRYSARVFSRYEGLLRLEEGSIEAFDETVDAAGKPLCSQRSRWRRLFVGARRPQPVPLPKVTAVLPLTRESPGGAGRGPGLLVITDGPWYEVGGLGEELGVEIASVVSPDPDDKLHRSVPFHELGTDPVVTVRSIAEGTGGSAKGAFKAADYSIAFDHIVGAIGHHRERTRTAPRFLASSFLLPPPSITRKGQKGPLPVDLSWCFLKLRFCRRVDLGPQVKKDRFASSDWSPPFWVQLLPSVDRVETDWFGKTSSFSRGDEHTILGTHGAMARPADSRFHLFGVLTRGVVDIAGRPDQEAYLGVCRPTADPLRWATDASLPGAAGKSSVPLFVRWIELQALSKPSIAKGEELWPLIFKADLADASRVRIVRMSRRFEVKVT